MLVARRLVLSGRVQGVGFRYFAQERARSAGVVGWIGNRVDGAVEAVLEGGEEAVGRLEGELRRGPRLADVDAVEAADVEPTGFADFTIRT